MRLGNILKTVCPPKKSDKIGLNVGRPKRVTDAIWQS